MDTTVSHVGICVSDIDASLRFYCEGLGFEKAETWTIGSDYARLMELPDVTLTSQFIRKDGFAIELLCYVEPDTLGDGERRAVNKLGFTHLNLRVDDVDVVAERLRSLGGTVLDHTRTTFGEVGGADTLDFVYCTDPDGTRVELMRLPG